jgi:hypothetical protein
VTSSRDTLGEQGQRGMEQPLDRRCVDLESSHVNLNHDRVLSGNEHESIGVAEASEARGHETNVRVSRNAVSTTDHHVLWCGVVQEVA